MVMEGSEIPNGWPLGLGNMGSRIIPPATAARTYATRIIRPTSFSSFSSSNLDTESSASFFPDHSVSLGRLIGIRPPNNISKGSLCSERRKMNDERPRHSGVLSESHEKTQGLCAPLLHHVIRKKGRNGNSSRH